MNFEKKIAKVDKEMDVFYKLLDGELRYASIDERNDIIILIKKLQGYRELLCARYFARQLMED